jgi:hypothetical protein
MRVLILQVMSMGLASGKACEFRDKSTRHFYYIFKAHPNLGENAISKAQIHDAKLGKKYGRRA